MKLRTIFLDRGYSVMTFIAELHAEGVSVFETARDFKVHTNKQGTFILAIKEGLTKLCKHIIKRDARNATSPRVYRQIVCMSGSGCPLEVSAASKGKVS